MKIIKSNKIKEFIERELYKRDIEEQVRVCLVNSLMNASLYGIDSHGVNLIGHYLDCIDTGRINPNNQPVFNTNGSQIMCDANFTSSHYAAKLLLNKLDELSSSTGIAIGSIINSDHIGAIGIHAANSGIEDKIILAFTNADALASTPDGKKSVFGTNPISLIYRKNETELLYIDLATTQFSMNKVKNYLRNNQELPYGVARDSDGLITTNPRKVKRLEPIGSHKGFALAFLVEALTSGITGLATSKDMMPMYGTDLSCKRELSHTFIMISPNMNNNNNHMWEMIMNIRDELNQEQYLVSPGIKETESYKYRLINGVPVPTEIYNDWIERGMVP